MNINLKKKIGPEKSLNNQTTATHRKQNKTKKLISILMGKKRGGTNLISRVTTFYFVNFQLSTIRQVMRYT